MAYFCSAPMEGFYAAVDTCVFFRLTRLLRTPYYSAGLRMEHIPNTINNRQAHSCYIMRLPAKY